MASHKKRSQTGWADESEYSSDYDLSDGTPSSIELNTPSSRIGSALKGWCGKGIKIKFNAPREVTKREPVFSARLGKEPRVQRTSSVESLGTQLSLLTCSMKNTALHDERRERRTKRRRQKKAAEEAKKPPSENPWLAFSQKKTGFFDRLMVTQNAQMGVNYNIDQSHLFQVSGIQSAYDLMDEDEREMLYKSAFNYGMTSIGTLKKSGSVSDISYKELDSKQDLMLAAAKSYYREPSPNTDASSKKRLRERHYSETQILNDKPKTSPESDKRIKLWRSDERGSGTIDRQFSDQVKERVRTATAALRSMSGVEPSNRRTNSSKQNKKHIKSNVNNGVRRISKAHERGIRISPELSQVISKDIVRRMGVPRHHEIRRTDVEIFDKTQTLDRRHRNLKVFNWLHSLNEEHFQMVLEPHIEDRPPGEDLVLPVGAMHIEACDDPDEKPFYQRAAAKFVHRVQQNTVATQS